MGDKPKVERILCTGGPNGDFYHEVHYGWPVPDEMWLPDQNGITHRYKIKDGIAFYCPKQKPPHFLIVGFPKCGTSFLFEALYQHPNIVGSFKEPKFFLRDHKDEGYAYKRAYKNWFSEREKQPYKHLLIGDGSPLYAIKREYLEKIKKWCPSSLIIVLVREPVVRAHSYFWQMSKLRKYNFDDYVQKYLHSGEKEAHRNFIFQHSQYEKYLPMVFELFPETLVIKSEDFFANPQKYFSLIFKHLGLEDFACKTNKVNHNRTGRSKEKLLDSTCKALNNYYTQTRQYMKENFNIHWDEYNDANDS